MPQGLARQVVPYHPSTACKPKGLRKLEVTIRTGGSHLAPLEKLHATNLATLTPSLNSSHTPQSKDLSSGIQGAHSWKVSGRG